MVSHRTSVLARRGVTGLVTFLLWMLLWVATTAVCATVGNSLPGVVPFEPSRALVLLVIGLGLPLAGMIAVMLNLIAPARLRGGRRVRWVAARGWFLLVRLLRDVLGLVTSRRQAILAVTAGLIAGLASVGVGYLLRVLPALVATAPATDARFDAVAFSPPWVPPAFFAINAAAPEELIYRGALLAVCACVLARAKTAWIRVTVITVALLGTSALFGLAHLHWSLYNAVSAGITGALFGAAAVATRSLWAAIIAHAAYNALIFIL